MKFKIRPIAGDASFRKFYRLISNKKSQILVFAQKEKYKNLIAYTTINKFLRANKVLTPKLYTHNFNKGTVTIEDFGDITFYNILLNKKNKLAVYKKLIDLLLKIQKIKPKLKIKNIVKGVHKIDKYTNKYLFKESNLFFDWYLPLFLKKKKSNKHKKKIRKNFNKTL